MDLGKDDYVDTAHGLGFTTLLATSPLYGHDVLALCEGISPQKVIASKDGRPGRLGPSTYLCNGAAVVILILGKYK